MLHRHALSALLVVGFTAAASAQPYWVRHVGSLGNDHINDVKADADGYLYVTGEFSGTADFENETLQSIGGLDFFVAKLSAEGEVIWWKRGGGYGLDRGIKLALGPNNTLAVVGEFMGPATFQGVTITSNNYTADMFVMRMDRTTGAQQWIRQGGGSEGADRPYGVTIAPNGQVTVAGEFKGTATWDGFSLTSIPDPETLIPTLDIVIVSYDATGNALWVQQGAADHTDRAIDVVNDPQGNIYVAGQFSDTITFDVEHLNAMYNATFLLKLDPAGTEVWFRRCGGALYDHVRDLLFTPNGELLLTGDLQGNMIFLDDVPDVISGEQDYNYYLLRVDTDGQFIASGQIGSDNGLSVRGVDLYNDTIAVVGQFNCQFSSMASFYGGTGLFMAAGSEDIFVNKHRFSDLGFIAARHYGGPGSKLAGQVAILPDGDPVICGSYTRNISFPATVTDQFDLDHFSGSSQYATYEQVPYNCPYQEYIQYPTQDCKGLKDGLLARAWVEDSVWYNWWRYPENGCEAVPVPEICIGQYWSPGDNCQDTLEHCASAQIHVELPFVGTLEWGGNSIGPLIHVLWNTGDTTLGIEVESTAWYSVQVDAANGCWSWQDSIYVIVHPMPPDPLISDDVVVNTNEIYPNNIHLCEPESALIWCANVDTTTTYFWVWYAYGSNADTLFVDTLSVDTAGSGAFYMITDAGCEEHASVHVYDHATIPLEGYDLDVDILFPQDTAGIDSVWLCQGQSLTYQIDPQWFLNGDSTDLPSGLELYYRRNGQPWGEAYNTSFISGSVQPISGWNHFDLDLMLLNTPCGDDTLLFTFSDQIWLGIWPSTYVDITVTGPSTMCVGDSALLVAHCPTCTEFDWFGAPDGNDSVYVHHDAYYYVYGSVSDVHGCSWEGAAGLTIHYPPGPLLLTNPANGIICPDDSARIYTNTPGTDQIWYTPFGPVPNNSQEIWSSVAGEYYLTMTDLQGCFITSDPVLLTGYGTPYLNISPDNILCLTDDEVLIQVVTTVPSLISWSSPFSGTSLQQIATQPGTYTVVATACGISTALSVTVVGSDVTAELTQPGPFLICPGDSVQLQAAPGGAMYVWQPGDIYGDVIYATEPGEYVLQAIDGNGCTDESAPVVVTNYDFQQPLFTFGDTICPGGTATLSATGSGTITWFADAGGQVEVFTGSPFVIAGLGSDTTFYVTQTDNTCTGPITSVTATVNAIDSLLTIAGPASACPGASITITAYADNATQYDWITPGGTAQGSTIIIDPVTLADAGLYTCTASAGDCGSVMSSFPFAVIATVPLGLGPDVSLCDEDTAVFTIDPSFTATVWNGAPGGYEYVTWLEGSVIVQAIDPSGCPAADTVLVVHFQFSLPLSANDAEICAGEDAALNAYGSGTITWSAEPDMDPVTFTGNPLVLSEPQTGSTWYIAQAENGCVNGPVSMVLTVNPVPAGAVIDAPSFTCAGDTLVITVFGPPSTDVVWTAPSGTFYSNPLAILDFSQADAGIYQAVPYIGECFGDTLEATVEFQVPLQFSLGPDTTFCIGASITFTIPAGYSGPFWNTGDSTYALAVSSDGTYTAFAIDDNGCDVQDAVEVMGEECAPVVPNFITPNGDGVNDTWHLDPARGGFRTAELIVFNRTGTEVFHADPSRTDFRGNNDTGEPLSEGVYFYVLRMFKLEGSMIEREGYLHVNR